MAYPATYDFNYYVGDTKDFILYPVNKDRSAFDLNGYTARFVIASERSQTPAWSVDAEVTLNATDSNIFCSIAPDVGLQLTQARYYYDVEVRKMDNGRELVYTLLRGTITPEIGVFK